MPGTPETKRRPKPSIIVLLAVALAASAALLFGGWHLLQARKVASWRRVRAEILHVEGAPYRYHSDGPRPGDRVGTRIVVTYRYEIDGESYTSTRYSLAEAADDWEQGREAEAAEQLRDYQRETHITAYVRPDDPTQAVIAPPESAPAIALTCVGGAGLLAFGMMALSRRRRARQASLEQS